MPTNKSSITQSNHPPSSPVDITFGDELISKQNNITRLLYHNTGSLGLSNNSHNLEVICDAMFTHDIDIASLVETNTHWKHNNSIPRLKQVIKKFWSRINISTSETITSWSSIYKPGGTVTITTSNIASTVVDSGEDKEGLGRWSYVTYGGKNKTKVTIVSAYRTCKPNDNQGVSPAHSQQWDILEERQQEHENIREKMIIDLIDFVQSLSDSAHEIIVCIDANEAFIPGKSGTARLIELTNLIDPLINKFGIQGEPPTYQGGSYRIDFLLCTPNIEKYIVRIGILPIHEISPSAHRGFILDVHLREYLNDLDHIPQSNNRLLSTQSPDSTLIYLSLIHI